MNYNRLREIDTRLTELRNQLLGTDAVDMTAISDEITALTNERAQLQTRWQMADNIGNLFPVQGAQDIPDARTIAHQRADGFNEPPEYRDAWALSMLDRAMTDEQRGIFDRVNAEYRTYTHTTENQSVLIPESVVRGIWSRAEEEYPLWADVRKFAVAGTLTMKKHTAINAGDAAWYDEDTNITDEQNTFAEISLSGCELAKSVTVSWKLRAMAVPEFIAYIQREIGTRMGVALGIGAWKGQGKPGVGETFKPQPYGIKTRLLAETNTPQTVAYTALTDAKTRECVAKLHSSYLKGACFYANNTTAWTTLANVRDGWGRSMFVPDPTAQGAVGRLYGKPVKVDAALADGEILFGNAAEGYIANISQAMTMHTEEHAKQRNTDYVGYSIVDGDVLDTKAFAYLYPTTAVSIGSAHYNVTQPAKAGTPQASHNSGTGYTAAIVWSPTATAFAASTVYTATVTLTAADGYRFPEDFAAADVTGLPATSGASATASSVIVARVSDSTATITVKYVATGA